MLEQAASRRAEAVRENLWAVVYGFAPRAYREVCSALEFAIAAAVAWELLGLPDNAKPVITEARVEGNLGYVDGYWESDGYQFDLGVAEGPTWVWRNNTWERHFTSEELARAKESCAQ